MADPPKLIYDEAGHLVEGIISVDDYLTYLREVAAEDDWESLPTHLQDAIDRMLIDEVRSSNRETIDLDQVLAN